MLKGKIEIEERYSGISNYTFSKRIGQEITIDNQNSFLHKITLKYKKVMKKLYDSKFYKQIVYRKDIFSYKKLTMNYSYQFLV